LRYREDAQARYGNETSAAARWVPRELAAD
jgi:hypothetical protein